MTFAKWEKFLGETARPWVLILSGITGTIATLSVVWMRFDLATGAIFVGAAWTPAITIYLGKAAEETRKTAHKAEAEAKIAEAGK